MTTTSETTEKLPEFDPLAAGLYVATFEYSADQQTLDVSVHENRYRGAEVAIGLSPAVHHGAGLDRKLRDLGYRRTSKWSPDNVCAVAPLPRPLPKLDALNQLRELAVIHGGDDEAIANAAVGVLLAMINDAEITDAFEQASGYWNP